MIWEICGFWDGKLKLSNFAKKYYPLMYLWNRIWERGREKDDNVKETEDRREIKWKWKVTGWNTFFKKAGKKGK